MSYVFGPVPSRRLGRSLGVDPVPLKRCNWNCVYCQLGRTRPYTTERSELVPTEAVLAELREVLGRVGPAEADFVTFLGSGEPTLHAGLGRMLREARAHTTLPLALLTNGYLLSEPEVRDEVSVADVVMPTVSAGTEGVWMALHRPARGLTFARFTQGLRDFRAQYRGRIAAEVMVVEGLNDGEEELAALAVLLSELRPDAIQVTLPTRPPSEAWVARAPASLPRVLAALRSTGIEVTAPEEPSAVTSASCTDAGEAILDIVQRHPMSEAELAATLTTVSAASVHEALEALAREGALEPVDRDGTRYYRRAR